MGARLFAAILHIHLKNYIKSQSAKLYIVLLHRQFTIKYGHDFPKFIFPFLMLKNTLKGTELSIGQPQLKQRDLVLIVLFFSNSCLSLFCTFKSSAVQPLELDA